MDKASAFSGLKRDFIDDTGTGEPYVSAGYAAPASGGLRLGGVEVAPAEAQTGRSGQMASGGAAQRPVPVAQRGDRRQTQVVQLDDPLFLDGARRVGADADAVRQAVAVAADADAVQVASGAVRCGRHLLRLVFHAIKKNPLITPLVEYDTRDPHDLHGVMTHPVGPPCLA